MTNKEMIQGILLLNAMYNNYNFDLNNQLKFALWLDVFKNMSYKEFELLVKNYAAHNPKFGPNSPMELIQEVEIKDELNVEEAIAYIRLTNQRYSLNYEKSTKQWLEAFDKYPVLKEVVKEYIPELKNFSGDPYVINQIKKDYQDALSKSKETTKKLLLNGQVSLIDIDKNILLLN
jgi:hypothetical protein